MDLFEDGPGPNASGNAPALTVSEISGAVKRVIEGEFARVRVRGEIGRVSRPGSGHMYFDLKDDRAVIAAVCWKGTATRLTHRPEEGMEVIAIGRLTTFPGQSKYQLLVEDVEPAGLGALMAMLDARRRQFQAEGLFHPDRKRPIPYLPRVIAVVTSPSGAVIRDILHRLRDRFPSRVMVYPVAVQGRDCAPQVAAAIRALNAINDGGPLPRPDLIIVARGGGSVEDLWGFNEEVVVRAVAEGVIPLISAVGHETDTTLIDHVADLRAPTPTAAAELAVPVLAELAARMTDARGRMIRAAAKHALMSRQRLGDLARGLGRPQTLTEGARQRFDLTAPRLEGALRGFVRDRRNAISAVHVPIFSLRQFTREKRTEFEHKRDRLTVATDRVVQVRRNSLPTLRPGAVRQRAVQSRRDLNAIGPRLDAASMRDRRRRAERCTDLSARLNAARTRTLGAARRNCADRRAALAALDQRLKLIASAMAADRRARLGALDRLRQTLGYTETLRRGFAVVRGPDGIVTTAASAANAPRLEVEFHDGSLRVRPDAAPARPRRDDPPRGGQKSLF